MSRRDERRRRLAIRKVLRMGHPVLRQRARPLAPEELGSDRIRALVDDMIDTMHDYGGIGLAAPQIGESIRLAVIEIPGGPTRYGVVEPLPLTVLANPTIEVLDETSAGFWEGCLSIPGLRGYVERPQHVRVEYVDLDGKPHAKELVGFLATVFQHELDHLDGTLYIDRIKDSRLLAFDLEYERYLAPRQAA
nr:peptide deformylase [Gammaproteobacteria bacterium]